MIIENTMHSYIFTACSSVNDSAKRHSFSRDPMRLSLCLLVTNKTKFHKLAFFTFEELSSVIETETAQPKNVLILGVFRDRSL